MRPFAILLAVLLVFGGCSADPEKPLPEQPAPRIAESPEELIQMFASAYRERDLALFKDLLANEPAAKAEYLFVTAPSPSNQDETWGYDEEARIHQRMFRPSETPSNDSEVPEQIWLESVAIALTPMAAFTERDDLYATTQDPDGLAPDRWKAMGAIYATDVYFGLKGEIDYAVDGRALFVVIEDLEKTPGEKGKFVILQWLDLADGGKATVASEEKTWGEIKNLYN